LHVRTSDGRNAPPPDGESPDQELARLRARVAEPEAAERKLNSGGHSARGSQVFRRGDALVTRFQFVADHRHAIELERLCQSVEVSRSWFYAWEAAAAARATAPRPTGEPTERIRAVHAADRAYGAPRATAELNDGAPTRGPSEPQAGRPGDGRQRRRRYAAATTGAHHGARASRPSRPRMNIQLVSDDRSVSRPAASR
jgi:hypothetical protein